jgi:thymidine kinase
VHSFKSFQFRIKPPVFLYFCEDRLRGIHVGKFSDIPKVSITLQKSEIYLFINVQSRIFLLMDAESFINRKNRNGWVEVIVGAMFSGKTEELIRRLERARLANQKVEVFKPILDNRYSATHVVSHDKKTIAATPVDTAVNILMLCSDVDVVGIDEAQFFDKGIVEVCNKLANQGIRVIVAGLDMDFRGNPFGSIPDLLAIAEDITKVHPICPKCGNLANYTHRKTSEEKRVLLGEKEIYEPLCRKCYQKATKIS